MDIGREQNKVRSITIGFFLKLIIISSAIMNKEKNLREKQVYDNFLKAIDEIIPQKPEVLVHTGDLFDVVKPRTRAY